MDQMDDTSEDAGISTFRFAGSTVTPPWNATEEQIVEWLESTPIDKLTNRGDYNGVFLGQATNWNGTPATVMVRFGGLRQHITNCWGAEYSIEHTGDLLYRELAAYEAAKAIGNEDLVAPVCIRELDVIEMVDRAVIEKIAEKLRVSFADAVLAFEPAASVQFIPKTLVNFSEYWTGIGADNAERWSKASDQLRFSIYRTYIMDFILGVPDRSCMSLMYNPTTDRLFVPDMSVSFPHSGYTTERYMQKRFNGWGQSETATGPANCYEFGLLFEGLDDRFVAEAVLVARELSNRMTDEMAGHLAMALIERKVPVECVGSLLMRLSYIAFAPGSVVKNPVEFIRNICMPIRADLELTNPKIVNVVEYANAIMQAVLLEEFDMLDVITHTAYGVEFRI